MAIRPVDLQVMVQKAGETTRINQHDNARPEVAQQLFAEQLEKQARHESQFVQESQKPEQETVDKDGRGPGSEGEGRGKGKERKKEDDQSPIAKSDSMFDISI